MTKALKTARSIARSKNLGRMLLHTNPGGKDLFGYVLLGLLFVLPGIYMLAIALTSEKNAVSADADWIVLGSVVVGCIAGAGFIFYALKKSKHQILLYEKGLVELRGNQINSAKYEHLQIDHKSVVVSVEGLIPIANATDYIMQFPNGSRSRVDWSHERHPVGKIIQGLIYQHQAIERKTLRSSEIDRLDINKSDNDWLWCLGGAVFCFAGAAYTYWYLTDLEASGGTIRMKAIVALLYMIGGKWLICLLFVVFGCFLIVAAIKALMQRR